MSASQHLDADREALSALFDGELSTDAARFVLKRLDHDLASRDVCGRWQLAGDALRGQAMAAAPADFAGRVGAAILAAQSERRVAADGVAARVGRAVPRPGRRRWIGGAALAASVAAAALFVARPLSDSTAPSVAAVDGLLVAAMQPRPDTTPPVEPSRTADALGPSAAATVVLAPAPPATRGDGVGLPGRKVTIAAAVVAAADVPRRVGERRAANRGARSVAGVPRLQAGDQARSAETLAALAPNVSVVPAVSPPRGADEHPSAAIAGISAFAPAPEIVSRPWPRAALPNFPAGGAFTVGFRESGGGNPPSFYPFEPNLAPDTGSAPGVTSGWPQQ